MTPSIPISFEFFPPSTPAIAERLREAAHGLRGFPAEFCSVTYGASGSSRNLTGDAVREVRERSGKNTAPHISCIATPKPELDMLLDSYIDQPIDRLVAIRGDISKDQQPPDALRFGSELVAYIRQRHGSRFELYVGAYPETHPDASSYQADLESFANKVAAGATAAVTQYFYSIDAFRRFRDDVRARNITIPLIVGVMPIHDFKQISNFSERCGAEIPRWLSTRMQGYSDKESQRDFATEVVSTLCEQLSVDEVEGFHFYTLNREAPTRRVLEALGYPDDAA